MSSSRLTDQLREPCEDESCRGRDQRTFYCVHCDCSFCDTCWDKQPAHKPNKRGSDGQAHEKIDRLVVERYRNILEPSVSVQEQDALHKDDEDTVWFGIGRNGADEPIFEDYGRFAMLMAQSLSNAIRARYPQLVSFIGQTGNSSKLIFVHLANIRQELEKALS